MIRKVIFAIATATASGCSATKVGTVQVCYHCIPSGCRAVVTPDGKVFYEKAIAEKP